ncbi:hypothetical protein F0562_032264 [Nyssa sinensis]|uniref:Uncharacterized protein n=1 Tax=Nyssa sinensis TaxID=561372 RepID=A0A5J5AT88_9ASTE|nr:hypothetical protein F0562_032264 [Nyssa sinensis]
MKNPSAPGIVRSRNRRSVTGAGSGDRICTLFIFEISCREKWKEVSLGLGHGRALGWVTGLGWAQQWAVGAATRCTVSTDSIKKKMESRRYWLESSLGARGKEGHIHHCAMLTIYLLEPYNRIHLNGERAAEGAGDGLACGTVAEFAREWEGFEQCKGSGLGGRVGDGLFQSPWGADLI